MFSGGAKDAGLVGGVEEEELDLEVFAGEGFDGGFATLGGAGAEDDVVSGLGELAADFEADAFVGSGDEDGLGSAHEFMENLDRRDMRGHEGGGEF